MREQINRVKNFGQFQNENKTEQYDSFIINVKYQVGYSDIDTKNILTSALQKSYKGCTKWKDYLEKCAQANCVQRLAVCGSCRSIKLVIT